jgi:hypothetical protein
LTEPPPKRPPAKEKEVISLAVLLDDVLSQHALLTRARHRKMYRTAMRGLPARVGLGAADRAFAMVAGNAVDTTVSAARIQADIATMKKTSARVVRRVNKILAHMERDQRRSGRSIGLREIDVALNVLREVHQRYALLVQGRDVRNLMASDEFDIKPELAKIWPPKG